MTERLCVTTAFCLPDKGSGTTSASALSLGTNTTQTARTLPSIHPSGNTPVVSGVLAFLRVSCVCVPLLLHTHPQQRQVCFVASLDPQRERPLGVPPSLKFGLSQRYNSVSVESNAPPT